MNDVQLLIADLTKAVTSLGEHRPYRDLCAEAAAALEQRAHWLECERSRADSAMSELRSETDAFKARIRELEAERETLTLAIEVARNRIPELVNERDEAKDQLNKANSLVEYYKAERDAIRAKLEKKDLSHTLLAKELDDAWERIKKLEAERDEKTAWMVCPDCRGVAYPQPCSRCNSVGCVPIRALIQPAGEGEEQK